MVEHAPRLKRAYAVPASADGTRVLVERLWPRGLTKEAVAVDHWLKDAAPSSDLRKWYGHDPARWPEFQTRYRAELATRGGAVDDLVALCRQGPVTFVFAARDEARNGAVVLAEYVTERL